MQHPPTRRPALRTARHCALAILLATTCACSSKTTPTPEPSPSASSGAVAPAPSAKPTASAEVGPLGVPVLVAQPFAGGGSRVHAIEGAVAVSEGQKVGVIKGEAVEWIGKLPPERPAYGANVLDRVYGRWPDVAGAVYSTSNGRAPAPMYWPLVGKGAEYTSAPGGGLGNILGAAYLGETTLVAGRSMMGTEISHVRGPAVHRAMTTRKDVGCNSSHGWDDPARAAIDGAAFAATPAGTVVLMGAHCANEKPAAEVWSKDGKSSRIIDLTKWWYAPYSMELLPGKGDDMWAISELWSPLLRLREGTFEPLPPLFRPVNAIFASAKGQLHAVDAQMIYRLEGEKWSPVGAFAPGASYSSFAMDESDTIWASGSGGVVRLRPDPSATVPAPSPDKCSTPFVYLYRSAWQNSKDFAYPSTAKALSTFPDVASITFVELGDGYYRYVGVQTATWAQGEALVTHIRATMPDEKPALFCHEPKVTRKIDIKPPAKK